MAWPDPGSAQTSDETQATNPGQTLPELVVTANRTPEPIGQSGSAISVVHERDLVQNNPTSLVDSLREVPGLDITETGGPGASTSVRLRGANSGQTLVLVDGIRVNDPSAASGDFDFSNFPAGIIQRIEVLRGPQSALYGSDAIGGVINIITRKGFGPPQVSLRTEAGSYGTLSTIGSFTGSQGPWSWAFTASEQQSAGFSRYGYRLDRITRTRPPLENDGFQRTGGSARIGYDAGGGVRLEAGASRTTIHSDYDAATGAFPDTPATSDRTVTQVYARAGVEAGILDNDLKVYFNRTQRTYNDVSYKTNLLPQNTTSTTSEFHGDRVGTEYQGNVRLGSFGYFLFGGRVERESADTFSTPILPKLGARSRTLSADQDTRSVFALYTLPILDRITITAGGRYDDVQGVDHFATWRGTVAYAIPETDTKLRASAGTGGKVPTLYQLYAPIYGNAALQPETSYGLDAGIDQSLFGGRMTASVTAFYNRLDNLIDFNSATQRYFNVTRAQTSGIEVGADAELAPDLLRLKVAYTYLDAKDRSTGLTLARRPADTARIALAITPTPQWLIEPRLYVASERFSNANETGRLAPYARFDTYAEYKIDKTWRVFARAENITGAKYQEVLNYGTTGRAVYGGVDVTW